MIVIDTIEVEGRTFNHAKSNAGYLMRDAQGRHYAEAIWPLDDPDREFTETRIPIDTEDGEERPRTFSKLRLEDALFRAGVLDAVDAFIDAQTITNEHGQTMPLRRKYQTANDFSEAHPLFVQFKTALQTALGWTDEQVEAVLAQATL